MMLFDSLAKGPKAYREATEVKPSLLVARYATQVNSRSSDGALNDQNNCSICYSTGEKRTCKSYGQERRNFALI